MIITNTLTTAATLVFIGTLAMPAMADTGKAAKKAEVPAAAETVEKPDSLFELWFGVAAKAGNDTMSAATVDTTAPKGGPSADMRRRIAEHARAAGLPVELAEAVIRHESGFKVTARGRNGEIGLMQIKPQTARALGYRGTTAGLYDVDTNLTWGMAYLAGAYKLASGDTCGTVLRYNAGHGATRMNRTSKAYCSEVVTYVASL